MVDKWLENIKKCKSSTNLDDIRIKILGKNGELTNMFADMKNIPNENKKEFAKNLNEQKINITKAIEGRKISLIKQETKRKLKSSAIDVSKYNMPPDIGALHPITSTMNQIINYFTSLNYEVIDGPLIEDDFHNFEALNLPTYHPARDMQDTFYFNDNKLLRTHTSPVQIRTMLTQKPPIRMIAPGKVFRRDFDITHTPMFNQVEGLVVQDEGHISFANLKHTMQEFLINMFGDVDIRFRPSFFPFTEPSAEVDISCPFCQQKGCQICSKTGWLEVLGCGVVDQNVFEKVALKNCSGFAFGLGVERFAMLLHKIPDLRTLFQSDVRLLRQFR
ncbi:MAG: phenylalanine--tRNA ligase subunit alpha [Epsilonproteobacteria bacterium]|nr:MAG: phenylalanine--tRNA ligase subunit alpha [Campylobacterota bacterium]